MKTDLTTRLCRAMFAAAAVASSLFAGGANAQDYPNRTVRLIVPFAAGGATDVLGRLIGQELSKQLGQPVVVENKAGAAGAIGTDLVAKAPPDGYTLCFCTTGPQVVLPFLTKLPYDPVKDLVPVIHVHNVPNVLLARPELPANNVAELIAQAKKQPGRISFASTGNGGPQHLAGELFQHLTRSKLIHVPYKGENLAFTDLAGGQIDTSFGSITVAEPLIKAGKIKALAVTGLQRSPALPNVPTVSETVKGFTAYTFVGINVPKGTPQPVIDRLNRAVNLVLFNQAVRERMIGMVVEPVGGTADAYADFLRKERAKWSDVIKQAKVTMG
ncbi:MAG TPA: tripartite tricarboxylate transporter substrate binding protein [Ramlibacter sp.]|nr:tripartite tricarboxylate transporter substrate binding protein [Ramlibacter sp.]